MIEFEISSLRSILEAHFNSDCILIPNAYDPICTKAGQY